MHKFELTVLLLSLLSAPVYALAGGDLYFLTDKDMYTLAERLEKSLRKCKEVRWHPEIIVELQNNTGELLDKTKFSELIHSMLERKTHAGPGENLPQYDVRAVLTSEILRGNKTRKTTYRLTAEVFQAEERFCKRSVKLTKLSNLGANKNKTNQGLKESSYEPAKSIPQQFRNMGHGSFSPR